MQLIQRLRSHSFFGVLVNFFNLSVFQGAGIVLQFLAIPLITHKYGIAVFGQTVLASSFAVFMGGITNYGTHQTAIKEVATAKDNLSFLSALFYKVLFFRSYAFLLTIPAVLLMWCTYPSIGLWLWLSTLPLILAEVFNPLYFLIGVQKIAFISWGNLLVKLVSLVALFFMPLNTNIAASITLMMGLPVLLYYVVLTIVITKNQRLIFTKPNKNSLLELAKQNFYIMFNGVAVTLQQSIFLFTLAGFVSAQTLGAYGLVDKLVGAVRQLVSSFSNALYPRAAILYNQNVTDWTRFKTQVNKGYSLVFGIVGLVILIGAPQIVWLLTGQAASTAQSVSAIYFMRLFALVPLVIALNANNVLSLLLQNKYAALFYISVLILVATALLSVCIIFTGSTALVGWYPLFIETFCLCIYTYFIRTKQLK
jgi:O-antigen/teichoic acid export membrane protein